MSATRTQVYLTEEQRQGIDKITDTEGISMAELIRRALDHYLAEHHSDADAALASTFGAAPGVAPPDRDEWLRG